MLVYHFSAIIMQLWQLIPDLFLPANCEKFALKIIFLMRIQSAHSSHFTQFDQGYRFDLGHTTPVLPFDPFTPKLKHV